MNTERLVPSVTIESILGGTMPEVKQIDLRVDDGAMPPHEVRVLLAILKTERPRVAFEIGTFKGHTTRQMAECLPSCTIHTIDLPLDYLETQYSEGSGMLKSDYHLINQREYVGEMFRSGHCDKWSQLSNIHQHFGDTASWDFSQVAGSTFFLIDGSHTFDYCMNDSRKCLAIAEPGSVLLWHDCSDLHPGVVGCISELRNVGHNIRRIIGTTLAYLKTPQTKGTE